MRAQRVLLAVLARSAPRALRVLFAVLARCAPRAQRVLLAVFTRCAPRAQRGLLAVLARCAPRAQRGLLAVLTRCAPRAQRGLLAVFARCRATRFVCCIRAVRASRGARLARCAVLRFMVLLLNPFSFPFSARCAPSALRGFVVSLYRLRRTRVSLYSIGGPTLSASLGSCPIELTIHASPLMYTLFCTPFYPI